MPAHLKLACTWGGGGCGAVGETRSTRQITRASEQRHSQLCLHNSAHSELLCMLQLVSTRTAGRGSYKGSYKGGQAGRCLLPSPACEPIVKRDARHGCSQHQQPRGARPLQRRPLAAQHQQSREDVAEGDAGGGADQGQQALRDVTGWGTRTAAVKGWGWAGRARPAACECCAPLAGEVQRARQTTARERKATMPGSQAQGRSRNTRQRMAATPQARARGARPPPHMHGRRALT